MNCRSVLLICACLAVVGNSAVAGDAPSSITLKLAAGENFISIPLELESDVLADVFPPGAFPAGKTDADSTVIFTYGATADARPRPVYYRLSEGGHWMYSTGGIADAATLATGEGFNIRLPATATAQELVLSGQATTTPITRALAGRAGETNYHVMSWPYLCPGRVGDLGLREAGFQGGRNAAQSDEIRILDNANGQGSTQTPKARIWLDAKTSRFEFTAPRSGSAEDYLIEPGEAVIVVRKRAPDLAWKLSSPCPSGAHQ